MSDVYKHFNVASSQRETRATEANPTSSRSHCLFTIDIVQQERTEKNPAQPGIEFLSDITPVTKHPHKHTGRGHSPNGRQSDVHLIQRKGEPPILHSTIVLADLAGSEKSTGRAGSGSKVGSDAFKEMLKINLSLTVLGNVAHALHNGAPHVPYRDSTLTRILRPSFAAPSSKVLLISNLAPSQLTYDESHATLEFANKVKAMKVSSHTIGAEHQQLQFEYLAAQQTQWALLADLHIARLHFNNQPMLRRYTDTIETTYYTHRLHLRGHEKERQQIIAGLQSAGRAEKERISREVAEQKERDAERMREMGREMYDSYVDEFHNRVACLQQHIDELVEAERKFEAELQSKADGMQAESREHEGVVAQMSEEKRGLRRRVERCMEDLGGLDVEGKQLHEQMKSAKARRAACKEDPCDYSRMEETYARAMWRHCQSQKFYATYRAYREAHIALVEQQELNVLHAAHELEEVKTLMSMAHRSPSSVFRASSKQHPEEAMSRGSTPQGSSPG
eukprot:TRINITY_DN3083_c0_g1_i1.p1 TRINITY_DN3083_c0_g1~~TRINITY_DN3083_c0_g1_i1.p1  ORF type:complete len:507 (+),score=207.17 TRINITY_DN3083_c0_g1_i1:497-2017(+)